VVKVEVDHVVSGTRPTGRAGVDERNHLGLVETDAVAGTTNARISGNQPIDLFAVLRGLNGLLEVEVGKQGLVRRVLLAQEALDTVQFDLSFLKQVPGTRLPVPGGE
jgi:hypothetical protein